MSVVILTVHNRFDIVYIEVIFVFIYLNTILLE